MKKFLAVMLPMILLLVAWYFLNKNQSDTKNPYPTSEPTETQVVGGDRDTHECIGSAGYSWCEPKTKCLRVWEEPCYSGVGQEIQYLLAKKYNKPADEVKISITKQDGDFVSGGVKFGNGGSGEGGVWLARRVENIWEVVFEGNGSIDCSMMRLEYGFPDTVLKPNFCD